jgi:HD-GYP domain-containing protein (c-di-GMP phosphodiesterase class II)
MAFSRLNQKKKSNNKKKIRVPIRLKITLPFLALSILLALAAAYIISQVVFDSLEERYTNQLIESGKLASEWMVREEDRLLGTLRLLSFSSGLPEILTIDQTESIRTKTLGIIIENQEEFVEFLDASGNHILSIHHVKNGNIEEYNYVKGSGDIFKNLAFVTNIVQNKIDSLGDKYSGFASIDQQKVFYVAGPVFDSNNKLIGIILIGKSLNSMVREIRYETLSQVTLYDLQGKLLASTFSEPIELPSNESKIILSQQDIESGRRSISDANSNTISSDRRQVTVSNINYDEILGPWEIRGDIDIGIIGAAIPKNFIVNTSALTRIQIFGISFLAVIIVIGIGFYLANHITKPLINLVSATNEVAEGNLEIQVKTSSNDEIAELTKTFNQMTTNLNISRKELFNAYNETLISWTKAMHLRDEETEGHMNRVVELSLAFGKSLGITDNDLVNLYRGALMHDIGKIGVPDRILQKAGSLTTEERIEMEKHPQLAKELIWPIAYLRPSVDIPYCHHEWWNGTGYPQGLSGKEIPLHARLFAIIDVWDALTSDRYYRKAFSLEAAKKMMLIETGKHFDPDLLTKFFSFLVTFHKNQD